MSELSNSNYTLNGNRSSVAFAKGEVTVTNERVRESRRAARFKLSDLVGVSYRVPTATYGWLHFSVADGTATPKGLGQAMRDPYALVIRRADASGAPTLLRLLAGYLADNPGPDRHAFEATSKHPLPSFARQAAANDAMGSIPSGALGAAPRARVSSQGAGLPAKTQRLYDDHIADPAIRFVIVGISGQAVVALDDRCVVLKPGWFADSTGGGRVTTFDYRDVTSVQIHTQISTGVLEILTASHSGSQKHDYWSTRPGHRPRELPNCIPIAKRDLKTTTPQVEALRQLVSIAKRPVQHVAAPAQTPGPSLAEQFRDLAELHESGVLSDDEFAQAKASLLASGNQT